MNKDDIVALLREENIFTKRMEELLDYPKGTCFEFYMKDDFTFFVKFCAVFEFALARAILGRLINPFLERDSIKNFILRLPLADVSTGKVKLARDLDLLEEEDAKFIRSFAEQRNKIAHDGNEVLFNLQTLITLLEPKEQKIFVKNFITSGDCGSQKEIFGDPINTILAAEHLKEFLYAGVIDVLCCIDSHSMRITTANGIAVFQNFANATWGQAKLVDDPDVGDH